MRPEAGNGITDVHRSDVTTAAREVGITPGDTVMFHSSLSSMGNVVGGPDTVIGGFLEVVGPEGTVAVPTLWWRGHDANMPLEDFDVDTSPSYPGLITEVFRQRPDSIRSNNPTHSVSAIGARAEELTRDHGADGGRPCIFGDTAFSRVSPWERLYQWNAAYCFIGVDFTVNTLGHYVETNVVEKALQAAPAHLRDDLEAEVCRFHQPGVWPTHSFQAMGVRLEEMGLVRRSQIGSATLRCIRARQMVDTIMSVLDAEPAVWFKPEFLAWLERAGGGNARS